MNEIDDRNNVTFSPFPNEVLKNVDSEGCQQLGSIGYSHWLGLVLGCKGFPAA